MAMRSTSSGRRTMYSPLSENITTMVNSSATSVIGLMRGMKLCSYHSCPSRDQQREAREHPGEERNAEIDEDALRRSAPMETLTDRAPQSKPARQHRDEEPGVDGVEQHLEDRVERDQARRRIRCRPCARSFQTITMAMQRARPIMMRPGHVLGIVAQEDDREREHQHGPITQFCTSESASTCLLRKTSSQLLVAHLRQRRVHHQDQADGDGDRCRADAEAVEKRHDARDEPARADPERHGGEDPDSEIAVEKAQTRRYAALIFVTPSQIPA